MEEPPDACIAHELLWVQGEDTEVDISTVERRPPAPSTVVQGRYREWGLGVRKSYVPDLRGRSREEVEREALRIRRGEYFKSWTDFNRCMDSWAVLNGRAYAKYASKFNYAVRVCRFGKTVRTIARKSTSPICPGGDADEGTEKRPHGDNSEPVTGDTTQGDYGEGHDLLHYEEDKSFLCGERNWTTTQVVESSPLQDKENSNVLPNRTAQQHITEGVLAEPAGLTGPRVLQNGTTVTAATETDSIGQEGGAQHGICDTAGTLRAVLGALNPNCTPRLEQHNPDTAEKENTRTSHSGALHKNVRSIVGHTSEWLPPRQAGKRRKRGPAGACGELGRFLPPEGEQEDDADEPSFCPFRVRAQRQQKTGRIHITKCDLRHTCPLYKHKWRAPSQNSKWLAETFASLVGRNVKVPIKEMQEVFRMDYHRGANYHQIWRAKDHARDSYLGGQRASFHLIPALMDRLVEADPSCIVDWCTEPHSRVFQRAFVCPGATRAALKYCQPLLCLDACHTKNRKYPTYLFMATALDGNSQIVIFCYAIATVQNTDNWVWFLQQMQRAVEGVDDPRLPFISDQQKGLLQAVQEVFPGKVHARCANHLRANVTKNYGIGAEGYFLRCVNANTKQQFEDILETMSVKIKSKGAAAVEYIKKIKPELYARHAFPLPRVEKVSSNPAEEANSGLLPLRDFAQFKLLVELWYYIQGRFNVMRGQAAQYDQVFTERAMRRHNKNLATYGRWQVLDDGGTQAKVQTLDHYEQYLVHLGDPVTCTCYELQEMLWPCEHIMAWDGRDGRDFSLRFHRCWRASSVRALYDPKIPCFLTKDLKPRNTCWPPEKAVKMGRHRIVRIQSGGRDSRAVVPSDDGVLVDPSNGDQFLRYPIDDEPHRQDPMPTADGAPPPENTKRARKRPAGPMTGKTKCSRCGTTGHNKRSCKAGATDPQVEHNEAQVEDGETVPEYGFAATTVVAAARESPTKQGIPQYDTSTGEGELSDQ